jgi:inhibitor of KinA sporulation pathway (predicted exonuclease)
MKKTKVSYFKNVSDTVPKDFSLHKWLKDTICPPGDLKSLVDKYRKTQDKRMKVKIPCVTISATFKRIRNLDNIKVKNELICLDIDKDSNPIADMNLVKNFFKKHPSTVYVGFSISEKGVYAIIKISEKKALIKYFEYFKEKLKDIGITIDESCKDYTRLRFFSVDENAYYNPDAKIFNLPKKPKKPKKKKISDLATKGNLDKVEAVVSLIEGNAIDITSEYSDWVKIAGALYNAFGEHGRDYFHRVSKYNHGYKFKDADRKFDNCRNMKRVTLSSFFYIADSYGIRY